jgi:uncharacterized secreted protein with C-terminal beta-propeller domain
METITQIELEGANPVEMLLYDGKLVIIWNKSVYLEIPPATPRANSQGEEEVCCCYGWNWRYEQDTVIEVYDTSGDFTRPISTYSQKGAYNSSRMIDNNIYLVTTFNPQPRRQFSETDLECYIPSFTVNGRRRFVTADAIILPENLHRVQYTVIGGLDVNKRGQSMVVSTAATLGWTQTVYASLNNIYTIGRDWEQPEITDEDEPIARDWWGWGNGTEYTVIDKFSINNGKVEFTANGRVPGTARNQFHFDEHNGNLRLVTEIWDTAPEKAGNNPSYQVLPLPETKGWWDEQNEWRSQGWWRDCCCNTGRESFLLCYDTDHGLQGGSLFILDRNMNVLSQVHRIGFGENVQSVRFMGDLAYIVTFWQTDPLFSFDLSNPRAPKLLGELKIPGFSRYLHSWDDGLLLGMGVETNDNGIRWGLKMTMFDVEDNTDLIERHVYVIGCEDEMDFDNWNRWAWYYSAIEWDHKAALVAPGRNIIGFPYDYSSWDWEDSRNSRNRSGTVYAVFSYSDDGFELIGEISHEYSDDWDDWRSFQRGLYIGEYVYAVANDLIVSAKLGSDSLTEVQRLKL